MRRNILFILLAICVTGATVFCGGQATTSKAKDLPPDFRKVNWEMNIADVKSIENNANLTKESDSELIYSISQLGCETTVKYFFQQNKLNGCVVDFGPPIADKNKYQKVYGDVFGLMLKKYGDFEKNDMQQIPGGIEMYSIWFTERSEIKLSSFIKNGSSSIIIKYIKKVPAVSGSDVNGMKWGISIDQVKAKESGRLTLTEDVSLNINGDKVIKYKETLAGVPAALTYVFKGDRLNQAIYVVDNKHTDKRKYAEEFIKINDLLMKRHNYPDKTTQLAPNFKMYNGSKQDWPGDFASGNLTTLSSEWNMRRTKVSVRLAAMGNFTMFTMSYETKLKFKNKSKKTLPPEADNI